MNQHPQPPRSGPLTGAEAAEHYVQRRTLDGVAVLTFAGPEGNRFDPDLVAALHRAIGAALGDPGVRALVLTARGADFCAGPWTDLPAPGPEPTPVPPVLAALADLCRRVEDAGRPVVVALHGRVASGGLALALAAQGRLADPRATLHFPEPRLARLPPGNGAVRLAWRAGAAAALRLLGDQRPIGASEALAQGLVDQCPAEGLLPAAIAAALALAARPMQPPARPGLADPLAFRAALVEAQARLPVVGTPARITPESRLIEVIEAAQVLPPDQALAFDLVQAEDAAEAPAARALAHLARATRRALDTPESRLPPSPPRQGPILAALGPSLAARLVPALLRDGASVELTADTRDALAEALEAVAEAQDAQIAEGRLTRAQAEDDWQRVTGRLHLDPAAPILLALAEADRASALEPALAEDTPLMIWTPLAETPAGAHPARQVCLVPAPTRPLRLVEVVGGAHSDPAVLLLAAQLVLRLRLSPLRAQGGAMLAPMVRALAHAAARLRALGVSPADLLASGLVPPGLTEGEVGPVQPLALPVERLLVLAVINCGARLLESGTCLRPSDLDLAMVLGAGWPNWRGGPMAEADAIGPLVLRHELREAADLDPDLWSPEPMFDELIRRGWRFEDLNTG